MIGVPRSLDQLKAFVTRKKKEEKKRAIEHTLKMKRTASKRQIDGQPVTLSASCIRLKRTLEEP